MMELEHFGDLLNSIPDVSETGKDRFISYIEPGDILKTSVSQNPDASAILVHAEVG